MTDSADGGEPPPTDDPTGDDQLPGHDRAPSVAWRGHLFSDGSLNVDKNAKRRVASRSVLGIRDPSEREVGTHTATGSHLAVNRSFTSRATLRRSVSEYTRRHSDSIASSSRGSHASHHSHASRGSHTSPHTSHASPYTLHASPHTLSDHSVVSRAISERSATSRRDSRLSVVSKVVKISPSVNEDGDEEDRSKTCVGRMIDDEDTQTYSPVHWINIIFLPFQTVFQIVVLYCVFVKTTIGPLQVVYPIITCKKKKYQLLGDSLYYLKFSYNFLATPIYGIDTFLHIIHRQVTEEATKREHVSKSAGLLILDVISMIPMFSLVVRDDCPVPKFWPDILAFNEILILYRVYEYFALSTNHSLFMLLGGYTMLMVILINFATCVLLLMTFSGLCDACNPNIYDWRSNIQFLVNLNEGFTTYRFGLMFILTFLLNKTLGEMRPYTVREYIVTIALFISGYIFKVFILIPKLYSECLLRLRRQSEFNRRVTRIVLETKRRNPHASAYKEVEQYFSTSWTNYRGITEIPTIVYTFPRYMRVDIHYDLAWSIFYHSPTFRYTSTAYRRWISEFMEIHSKMPGEKFFAGQNCFTKLYYLKSGIIQIMASDDSTSPMLSLSGGTILGDVSFFVPPFQRQLTVRCLTNCEIFSLSRKTMIKSLYLFPLDRKRIMKSVRDRLQHAQDLFFWKEKIRGEDRTEDEGIAWIKVRWWEISRTLSNWKRAKKQSGCEIPADQELHHCAKYVGQLVLCKKNYLKKYTMFSKIEFPWILLPDCLFIKWWHRFRFVILNMVLLLYPPNVVRTEIPTWFIYFEYAVDLVYELDAILFMFTSPRQNNMKITRIIMQKCRTFTFLIDVLSLPWIDTIFIFVIGASKDFYQPCQLTRVIKTCILFFDDNTGGWTLQKEIYSHWFFKITFIQFSAIYVSGYILYLINRYHISHMTSDAFFGYTCSAKSDAECDLKEKSVIIIFFGWIYRLTLKTATRRSRTDYYIYTCVVICIYVFMMYMQSKTIAAMYLEVKQKVTYNNYVSNLKKYYIYHKIHPDLLKRLNKYLICHWKYFHGMDVLQTRMLDGAPYNIYWKLHGELAEKIIVRSKLLEGMNKSLIRDVVFKSNFLLLPETTTVNLFGAHCKNVTWLVKGVLKCEYHDEDGELIKHFISPQEILSVASVISGRGSLRTYTAETDIEILYLDANEFFTIIKQYPEEWQIFQHCMNEFEPRFKKIFLHHLKRYQGYQKKLRDKVFHARQSVLSLGGHTKFGQERVLLSPNMGFLRYPESPFILFWLTLRMVTFVVLTVSTALKGIIKSTGVIIGICDSICLFDIGLKLFLPYYNKHGIVIRDPLKIVTHYVSRGLAMDVLGCLPILDIVKEFGESNEYEYRTWIFFNTLRSFSHLYLFTGYFDYILNVPMQYFNYIMIIKWQVVLILLMMCASTYFVYGCIIFTNEGGELRAQILYRNESCWLPMYAAFNRMPFTDKLFWVVSKSMDLVQNTYHRSNVGMFRFISFDLLKCIMIVVLGYIFWYGSCYCRTLLILQYRGNTLFQHGVQKLISFLEDERVENKIIDKAVSHFTYGWKRSNGLNVQCLMGARMGVVFKQDLNFYFFKKTFEALDSVLQGGEAFQRNLSNVVVSSFFLKDTDIMREMDLMPSVFIVHRGSVIIHKESTRQAILTKGGIFGQLTDSTNRPIRITATTESHCDVLEITVADFQATITEKVKKSISKDSTASNDYIIIKKIIVENPYNTIQYILRGAKTIQLPWMTKPIDVLTNVWYSRWLYFVWLGVTSVNVMTSLLLHVLSEEAETTAVIILECMDAIYILSIVLEFYTACLVYGHHRTNYHAYGHTFSLKMKVELTVKHNKCVYAYMRLKKLRQPGFVCDVIALIMPIFAYFCDIWWLHLFSVLRLHNFIDFHHYFCKTFKNKVSPMLLKFIILILILHASACGWIYVACTRYETRDYPIEARLSDFQHQTVDWSSWDLPAKRPGGCATYTTVFGRNKNDFRAQFVVAKNWRVDYLVALTFILTLQTHTDMDIVADLNSSETYYKVFITIVLSIIEMWMSSVAISTIYTKYRELYVYDFKIRNLTSYLKYNGLTMSLVTALKNYTKLLWNKQRGNWLPEMALEAPQCLREDIFTALYMHHLEGPSLFKDLPKYILRQIVVKFRRIVIFPGKYIVEEGDVWPCMYFIHEGEVEQWYTDANGDSRVLAVLTQNGFFGLIPGLFPNAAHHYTYYTRTVVDVMVLKYNDWADILAGYPDVREQLYKTAEKKRSMKGEHY